MHEIKVIGPLYPETYRDDQGVERVRRHYSFTVDGVPSLYWQPECATPGLPPTYFIDRTIKALDAGLSREAFGGGPALSMNGSAVPSPSAGRGRVYPEAGETETETVAHGGRQKAREKRKGWKVALDGVELAETYPTEPAAKRACAIMAFMTRGKVGHIPRVLDKLKTENPGRECAVFVCPDEHEVAATVDGRKVGIVWVRTAGGGWGVEKFKPKE